MPRKRIYSLVTVMRKGDDIVSHDIAEGLDLNELTVRLAAPSPALATVERHVFGGSEIPWSPTVRLGAPPKSCKASEEKKSGARKPREPKTGTPSRRASASS